MWLRRTTGKTCPEGNAGGNGWGGPVLPRRKRFKAENREAALVVFTPSERGLPTRGLASGEDAGQPRAGGDDIELIAGAEPEDVRRRPVHRAAWPLHGQDARQAGLMHILHGGAVELRAGTHPDV